MLTFHGKNRVKQKYLRRVRAHAKSDQIIKGVYWVDGKGCAVGCTIHGDQHDRYEAELGIPESIACMEDRIFEGLPNDLAMTWPERFLDAIPVGVDLARVLDKFVLWILADEREGALRFLPRHSASYQAVREVSSLLQRRLDGNDPTSDEWVFAKQVTFDAMQISGASALEITWFAICSARGGSADQSKWLIGAAAELTRVDGIPSSGYVRIADKLLDLLRAAKK